MRAATEKPVERMAVVRRDMPLVTEAMAVEFLVKCRTSTKIDGAIPTSATYHLWSPTSGASKPLGKGSPEIAIYFLI
jgi:hypothetical protein